MLSSGVFFSPLATHPNSNQGGSTIVMVLCHAVEHFSFHVRKRTNSIKFRCQISDVMSQKSNDTSMQRLTHFIQHPSQTLCRIFLMTSHLRRGRPRRSYQHLRERRISGKADRQIDFSSAVNPEDFSTVPSSGIVLLGTFYEYRVTSYVTAQRFNARTRPLRATQSVVYVVKIL